MTNGIDVSSFQKNIDWRKVAESGIKFAIIRCGWGMNNIDSKAIQNIEGALSVGIKIGCYWFIYGKNQAQCEANADKFNSVIAKYKDKITMKVWADWEYDSDKYCPGLTKAQRTQWTKAFCKRMSDYGYDVGIYANRDYLTTKFTDIREYPLWYAIYSSSKGNQECFMWQNSSKGQIPGISGNVDTDYCYADSSITPTPSTTIIDVSKYPLLYKKTPMMTGEYVMLLQKRLTELGYDPKGVDGKFGANTDKAVRSYQAAHKDKDGKKLVVDGKVGQKTWYALMNL